MVAQGFVGEGVEFSCLCVSLDLAVPCRGIKIQ